MASAPAAGCTKAIFRSIKADENGVTCTAPADAFARIAVGAFADDELARCGGAANRYRL
jgi:hypothetical protein